MSKAKEVKIRPLGTRAWVEPTETKTEKIGSLFVPDTSVEKKPTTGIVKAIGPDAKLVKVGDVIIYGRYAGQQLELPGGEKVFVIKEEDIIAVQEK